MVRYRGDIATVSTAESVRAAQAAAATGEGASIAGVIGMLASVAIFVGLFVVATLAIVIRASRGS